MARSSESVIWSAYMMTRPSAFRAARPMVCIERGLGAQKALFVRVEYGHQPHLGQVETLAQQVDAHQHVELAQPAAGAAA